MIYKGYQGMVDGGEYFEEVTWHDVSGIMQQVVLNRTRWIG